jgi:membrane peptidoglycan carboxypeptidase
MHGEFYYIVQLNFVLQDNLTQQQCLNKSLEKTDFTNRVIGVENFAMRYFGKPLKELNEDQVLEILVRLKNPSLYNKEKTSRHQIFMDRFNTLKGELEKNRAKHE